MVSVCGYGFVGIGLGVMLFDDDGYSLSEFSAFFHLLFGIAFSALVCGFLSDLVGYEFYGVVAFLLCDFV